MYNALVDFTVQLMHRLTSSPSIRIYNVAEALDGSFIVRFAIEDKKEEHLIKVRVEEVQQESFNILDLGCQVYPQQQEDPENSEQANEHSLSENASERA